MKRQILLVFTALIVASMLLSACGAAPTSGGDDGAESVNESVELDDNSNSDSDDDLGDNANDDDSNSNDDNDNDDDSNSNDDDSNDDDSNSNDDNDNDSNSNDSHDDSSSSDNDLEYVGTLEVVGDGQVQIDGMVFDLANFSEIKGALETGTVVKVHLIVNDDGTFTIREIELADADADLGWDDDNTNDDNGNANDNDDDSNSNDDDDDD
ncbi:MAG: hypothetical protein HOD49_03390, partial [Anaerolineae bacterium]|nr:hypothetical protein [Anaerolineae bacterium]